MSEAIIIDTNPETISRFGMCGYKNLKNEGYRRKVEWVKSQFANGMRYKILLSEKHGALGGIEYIPAENAWRPVDAPGYMFIHCIYIMKKDYKGKGYGRQLLDECIDDARKNNMAGVATIARKGTWMPKKELFLSAGFESVDKAKPDFELMALKFDPEAPDPEFRGGWDESLENYPGGLTIITSDQCPYTEKAVREISETATAEYGIAPNLVELKDSSDAMCSPCAFGTFCILYENRLIAEHPISNTRFKNIMGKILK